MRGFVAAVMGPPSTRRMAIVHGIDDVADSLITLSLVGSLFFSVSLDASRSRILTYLLVAVAPLAVIAPAVGPFLDRTRAGYRTTVLGSQLIRAVLAVGLAGSLLSVAFYPLVFGILLMRKAYTLAKTAVVAQLAPDETTLVVASGHIARTGTIAGGFGTALGGLLIGLVGTRWLPVAAAVAYCVAAAVASRLPVRRPEYRPTGALVRAEVPADVRLATFAVSIVRASQGALTFVLAFAIKRAGSSGWAFAAALVAAGIGAFAGTLVAPRLRRRLPSSRMILLSLLLPTAVIAVGVIAVGDLPNIAIAFAIGLGGSVTQRAMDGLYGSVPTLVRGRAISQCELIFQIANVSGAAAAVFFTPSPRIGFAWVGLMMLVGGTVYSSRLRLSLRREAGSLLIGRPTVDETADLPSALIVEAVHHLELGNHRVAIAIADTAVRLRTGDSDDDGNDGSGSADTEWTALRPAIDAAIREEGDVTPDRAVTVVAAARRLVEGQPAA